MTSTAFQIHPMEIQKLGLTEKEKSAINPLLLTPINAYVISREINEYSPRYQDNYTVTSPITNTNNTIESTISLVQRDHLTFEDIEALKEIETNELKRSQEIYETISLEKYDNIEEKSSCKCNKNTIATLCIVVPLMTASASAMGYILYLICTY